MSYEQPNNLTLGDFALVKNHHSEEGRKLKLKWVDPHRVTRFDSELVYEAYDLIRKSSSLTYSDRLKLLSEAGIK